MYCLGLGSCAVQVAVVEHANVIRRTIRFHTTEVYLGSEKTRQDGVQLHCNTRTFSTLKGIQCYKIATCHVLVVRRSSTSYDDIRTTGATWVRVGRVFFLRPGDYSNISV
jgi:hypothetical protein